MPLHGLGVNSIDGKPLVEPRTNERTMRRREGDEDVVRRLVPCTDSGYELIQALRRVLYRPPSPAWCRRHLLNNTRGPYRPIDSDQQHLLPPPRHIHAWSPLRDITSSLLWARRSRRIFLPVVKCRTWPGRDSLAVAVEPRGFADLLPSGGNSKVAWTWANYNIGGFADPGLTPVRTPVRHRDHLPNHLLEGPVCPTHDSGPHSSRPFMGSDAGNGREQSALRLDFIAGLCYMEIGQTE